MQIVNLVIDLYHLIVRAVVLALTDAEFAADWGKFEADLAALGVDLPGEPAPVAPNPSPAPASSAQAVAPRRAATEGTIINPDGTVSLKEG